MTLHMLSFSLSTFCRNKIQCSYLSVHMGWPFTYCQSAYNRPRNKQATDVFTHWFLVPTLHQMHLEVTVLDVYQFCSFYRFPSFDSSQQWHTTFLQRVPSGFVYSADSPLFPFTTKCFVYLFALKSKQPWAVSS